MTIDRDAVCGTFLLLMLLAANPAAAEIGHLQGEMAGEVSTNGVLLQSRLTALEVDATGDVPGAAGVARFEIADNAKFEPARQTEWLQATGGRDFVIKAKITGLKPATKYYYRLIFGADKAETREGPTCSFRTHFPADELSRHSFVVVTGMNYHYFHHGYGNQSAYTGPDKQLGFPALASILQLQPDFFVGTGDNVYYDSPRPTTAKDAAAMRKKWHEQFVQQRYVELFASVPTYWEKDDHDYRYDDCDNTGDQQPSVELGLRIFREQVPITAPSDSAAVTYRTYRCGKLLQVWFPENRDYRSPNLSPDGPDKTIWGQAQREWLERTLVDSDATFRIIVSPTPMIGPDDLRKKDNHADINGFRHERDSFFRWATDNGLLEKGLWFVCGDRHWQYHSIHPSGFEEFSSGALVDANARLGVKPGDEQGSDPEAKIKQPYTSRKPSGGFLNVVVESDDDAKTATLDFRFFDEKGELLHSVQKARPIRDR
jgi:alkaline phosphatase/alkaline phosphatase D